MAPAAIFCRRFDRNHANDSSAVEVSMLLENFGQLVWRPAFTTSKRLGGGDIMTQVRAASLSASPFTCLHHTHTEKVRSTQTHTFLAFRSLVNVAEWVPLATKRPRV